MWLEAARGQRLWPGASHVSYVDWTVLCGMDRRWQEQLLCTARLCAPKGPWMLTSTLPPYVLLTQMLSFLYSCSLEWTGGALRGGLGQGAGARCIAGALQCVL